MRLEWTGQPAAIIGCGPSANRDDAERLRGKVRTVVVNRAFELAPWADVLYACDPEFWRVYPSALAFEGLKVCQDERFCRENPAVQHVQLRRWNELILEPGTIADGINGGFQAFNLVVQGDANPILLLGFDMSGDRGLHFHGDHPRPLTNPSNPYSFDQWRNAFNNSEAMLRRLGVKVINCAPASLLNTFPKMSVAEALQSL